MNPIKQLFSQTAVYGMGIVLPRLLNYLLLTPFYTRIFVTEDYGIVTELYAYVVFLLVILTYGMETGFFRFATNDKRGNANTVYTSTLLSVFATSSIFILLLFSFIHPVAGMLGYGSEPQYIKWLACIVAIDAFTAIPFARIRLQNKPLKYALIRIAEVIVNIGLNWFFLFYCARNTDSEFVMKVYNPNIGVGYVLISNLAASILKMILLVGEILAATKGWFDKMLLKKILIYAYPLLIAGLAGTINEALDRVLLKHLIDQNPMVQLGIYGANYKIAVLMTLYVQMFKYAAEPFFFSKSKQKDAKTLYADVLMFFILPGLLIFLGVMLYIDFFKLFIGVDFREGVGIVPVILMANLIMGVFFNLSIWYKLTNKTMTGAMLVAVGALITITINVLFVPKFGYVASAWGHLICYTVMVALSFFLSRRHYKIPYDFKRILFYIVIIVGFYGIDLVLSAYIISISMWVKPLLILAALLVFYMGEKKRFIKYKDLKIEKT